MSSGASPKSLFERPFRAEILPECLDGITAINYVFLQAVPRAFVEGLADLGTVEFRDDFPRPLFKVKQPFHFHLIGIVGACEIRVDYDEKNIAQARPQLENRFARMKTRRNQDES